MTVLISNSSRDVFLRDWRQFIFPDGFPSFKYKSTESLINRWIACELASSINDRQVMVKESRPEWDEFLDYLYRGLEAGTCLYASYHFARHFSQTNYAAKRFGSHVVFIDQGDSSTLLKQARRSLTECKSVAAYWAALLAVVFSESDLEMNRFSKNPADMPSTLIPFTFEGIESDPKERSFDIVDKFLDLDSVNHQKYEIEFSRFQSQFTRARANKSLQTSGSDMNTFVFPELIPNIWNTNKNFEAEMDYFDYLEKRRSLIETRVGEQRKK